MSTQSKLATRRALIRLAGISCILVPLAALADALDTVAVDPSARILRKALATVPAANPPGSSFGVIGADISIPGRGFLGLDWSIEGRHEVTLMVATAQQKNQLLAGHQPAGDPLMRLNIQGPETAGQDVPVGAGAYFVAFLNREPAPVQILYRASFQAF